MSNNRRGRCNGGGHDGGYGGGNGGGGFPQQLTWFGDNGAGAQQPSFPPTPYNTGKIGTTATPMAATWTTPTQAQHVAITARPTIPMQAVPTSWAAQLPECARPSCRQHVAASHPPPSPLATATPTATPTRCILPHPRYKCPTRIFWSNPTCRWHQPPADDHGHAGYLAWSNHDEFCWPAVPSKRQGRSNDAAADPAGNAHDGTLLCSQPADLICPQSTASGVFPISKGGQ